jgi:hypothetical protein
MVITQVLGCLLALARWMEYGTAATPRLLIYLMCGHALTAMLIMLAALAGDQAVRRRMRVVHAFFVVALTASALNALAQWLLDAAFGDIAPGSTVVAIANNFFDVGVGWSTIVLVYLNRQSAGRLLARLRTDELARAVSEQRVIASSLAGAEARMDPASVLRQLSEVRALYASGHEGAEERLEDLIATLRHNAARCAAAEGSAPGPRIAYL